MNPEPPPNVVGEGFGVLISRGISDSLDCDSERATVLMGALDGVGVGDLPFRPVSPKS